MAHTPIPILVAHNQSTVPDALPYILPWCNPVQQSPAELLTLSLIIDTTLSNYHCYQPPPQGRREFSMLYIPVTALLHLQFSFRVKVKQRSVADEEQGP